MGSQVGVVAFLLAFHPQGPGSNPDGVQHFVDRFFPQSNFLWGFPSTFETENSFVILSSQVLG